MVVEKVDPNGSSYEPQAPRPPSGSPEMSRDSITTDRPQERNETAHLEELESSLARRHSYPIFLTGDQLTGFPCGDNRPRENNKKKQQKLLAFVHMLAKAAA
ncbi:hypothetical protein MW887_010370 [Aspergillus wentii]|nr:hypothetical protein MW887_010370 [Aspergillus wentii]